METQEIWKPVVGYEDFYEVSNFGRVKSIPRKGTKGGIMKPQPTTKGDYLQIDLYKNGKREPCQVHQIVMRAFIGECPENHEVDHENWRPEDNRLENLSYKPKEVNRARHSPEWYKNTAEANRRKAQDPEWIKKNTEKNRMLAQDQNWRKNHAEGCRKAFCKPVDQFTLDGVFVKTWESAKDAARELGFNPSNISHCLNGKQHTAGGYVWRYA